MSKKTMMNQEFSLMLLATAMTLSSLCTVFGNNESSLSMRVAAAQIPVTNSISENSDAIHRALTAAIEGNADVLLTPEGSLSGYRPKFDQARVEKELAKIVERASKAGIALALGTCFTEP